MITGNDFYNVLVGIVPLYVAMILAYGSVRWWKIFTPDQCSGINRFVAVFAVPLLSFHFISANNPYTMSFRFLVADSLQKLVILGALFVWIMLIKSASLEWMITLFSLSTLPNTLVMGIPLLTAMYGDFSSSLMIQIVVLQSVIWYTLMIVMFEYRGAKFLLSEQFPDTAGTIKSVKVESDVMSLGGLEPIQADAEIGEDGKLHVIVRRSSVATSDFLFDHDKKLHGFNWTLPRASNFSGVEIYSVQSTPRTSRHGYKNSNVDEILSPRSSQEATVRISNYEDEMLSIANEKARRSMGGDVFGGPREQFHNIIPHQLPNHTSLDTIGANTKKETIKQGVQKTIPTDFRSGRATKPVHNQVQQEITTSKDRSPTLRLSENGSAFRNSSRVHDEERGTEIIIDGETKKTQAPPAHVMTKLILIMVWRKLIRNPNTYASLVGLIWSLISFRFHIKMPTIVSKSISILSDAGLGMAMFSLGLFMALQPKMIACGKRVATFAMAIRFLVGPAVTAATSVIVGLRGDLLRVAIIQAALPQGIVPFVFAKEYDVHPYILSTSVIFGMLIALPITIVYYIILGVL